MDASSAAAEDGVELNPCGPALRDSLVMWDVPLAPEDAKKTNKLRRVFAKQYY